MSKDPLIQTSENNYWKAFDSQRESQKIKSKVVTHEEFMQGLNQSSNEERMRIERDMNYLYKTFEDCAYLIEFQDGFIGEIDKSLKQAEENSKNLLGVFKKESDKASCQQKLLNSVIGSLICVVIVLGVLAFFVS